MYKTFTLKNGLKVITINLPHLESVTTLLAVGAGSRYENKNNNGISHFLEHMFFKGSKKYPSAEEISKIVDGMGAINNAWTDREATVYWIKSSAKKIETAVDILSSMAKESLLAEEEIEREKGVITEEIRMIKDDPARYIWSLYLKLHYGNHPLGWDVIGSESTIAGFERRDFVEYMSSLYSPKNMSLVFAGHLPKDIFKLAQKYFQDLPGNPEIKFAPVKPNEQKKAKINVFYKKTDQASLILGVESYNRHDKRRYVADLLSTILGEGMSSRLFLQVRERRGLAYYVRSFFEAYKDAGAFLVNAGLKIERLEEAIKVIKDELEKLTRELVSEKEMRKAKESIRGRLALRSESTNFLAEYFGVEYIMDKKIETFDEFLKNIDQVSAKDVQLVAQELFQRQKFNLQIIGPFKSSKPFEKILES